jgi:mannose-6-phosphate isomerase-like protein (cupin superfamily)
MKISLRETLAKLPLPATAKWPQGVWDVIAFERGTTSLLLFAPKEKDYQTPHSQDELYIVLRGSGTFLLEGQPIEFEAGDVLFAAARQVHRFERFTGDLLMWVVFWGPHRGASEGLAEKSA